MMQAKDIEPVFTVRVVHFLGQCECEDGAFKSCGTAQSSYFGSSGILLVSLQASSVNPRLSTVKSHF